MKKKMHWLGKNLRCSFNTILVLLLCIISPHQLPPLMWCIEYAERYPILVITEILEKGEEPGFCPQITGFIFLKKLGLELNVDSSYYFVRNETPRQRFLLASAILILSKCQRQLSKENFKIALGHKFFFRRQIRFRISYFFWGTICNLGESLVNALFIFRRHKLVMHFHKCHILCVLLQVTLQKENKPKYSSLPN